MGPKVLFLDIETYPMQILSFSLRNEYTSVEQIIEDGFLLSFACIWLDSPNKTHYFDTRTYKGSVKKLAAKLREFLHAADVVVTQYGKRFDTRYANAMFEYHDIPVPSPYQQADTKELSQKHFKLPSYKLEYLAKFFKLKMRKLTQRKYVGMKLWVECGKGNKDAWREMKLYNSIDVALLVPIYKRLLRWGIGLHYSPYYGEYTCACGSKSFLKEGVSRTKAGVWQRFSCKSCGAWHTDKSENILNKRQRLEIKGPKT